MERPDGVSEELSRASIALLDNALPTPTLKDLFEYTVAREQDFIEAWVLRSEPDACPEVDRRVRQNLHLKGTANVPQDAMTRIRELVPPLARSAGIWPNIDGRATFEAEITATGDGGFFLPHIDNGNPRLRGRTVSFSLFFSNHKFTGGQLRIERSVENEGKLFLLDEVSNGSRLEHPDIGLAIQPITNRLVVFRSDRLHEVQPVCVGSSEFANRRFAVTGFVRWNR